ncbi:hypothetical protein HAX54_023849, partial [Datura stramonium]|nr:hypothetical protein [Datura stramonium]
DGCDAISGEGKKIEGWGLAGGVGYRRLRCRKKWREEREVWRLFGRSRGRKVVRQCCFAGEGEENRGVGYGVFQW